MHAADALRVGGLTPLTTIDYPGELAAVVFCQGCPWRCRYCHNPALLPPRGAASIPWRDVRAFLERRRALLDAVVFSGGEPTLQDALEDAVAAVRSLGFKVGLHSAGIYPARLRRLLPRLDWVGLDVKALPGNYPSVTGAAGSGAPAWESARHVIDSGVDHELRITVHPALTTRDEAEEIAARLRALGARRIVTQPCREETMRDPTLAAATHRP